MSDNWGEVRKRGRNLLIVEGNHERNILFWLLFQCFPEVKINMDDVWIYGTNIYRLYEDIAEEYGSKWAEENDDIDLPFVISKKNLNTLCYKNDFTNIILVFDYERHDTNFSENKILEMQKCFTDAADMGKLYLNYPMIESYQHLRELPDDDYKERKIPVSLQPGKEYKKLVRNETVIAKAVEFPHKIEGLLREHFEIEDKQKCGKCYSSILNISNEEKIADKIQEILQGAIEEKKIQTAKYQFEDLVTKIGYAKKGQTFWEYMREIFCQIILHNICKANWVQNGHYTIGDGTYKECFENLDMVEILREQNRVSQNIDTGYIWVLNTCVLYVAEYNFALIV